MRFIFKQEDYNGLFPNTTESGENKNKSKREMALNIALDTRKFEIELYWKRATYFWTFIAATFAGYFLIYNADKTSNLLIILSSIGFIFSIGWYLANRGSKFWQKNWERHIDALEDDITGPLYKTTIDKYEPKFFKLHDEYSYSVSKINQIISLFIVSIWLFLIISNLIVFSRIIFVICLLSLTSIFIL